MINPTPLSPYFLKQIEEKSPPLSKERAEKAAFFAEILYRHNQVQNLTRIGPEEFVTGHLIDVLRLFESDQLGSVVMDVGSGCGVPGLLAAAIDEDPKRKWILVDSELQKANYLFEAAQELGLSKRVSVHHDRVENVLKALAPTTIIARAVGTVDKISAWIWNCSTWNNLVLFKSLGWDEEWRKAQESKYGKKLTVSHSLAYSIEGKSRVLVTLKKNKNG